MKKWLSVLLLAAVSLPLNAQSTTTTPTIAEIVAAQVARLTKLLTLTTAQAASATATFTTEVTAVQPLQTSLATARTALDTAVESDTGIAAAIAAITSLQSEILQAEATADATFYATLTTAQQTIYRELLAAGLDSICALGSGPIGVGPGNGGQGGR